MMANRPSLYIECSGHDETDKKTLLNCAIEFQVCADICRGLGMNASAVSDQSMVVPSPSDFKEPLASVARHNIQHAQQ